MNPPDKRIYLVFRSNLTIFKIHEEIDYLPKSPVKSKY